MRIIQNKHITRLTFICLFFNIVIYIFFYRYFIIRKVIIKEAYENNLNILSVYKTQVWDLNQNVVSKINTSAFHSLLNNVDFMHFIRSTSDFLQNIKVTKISLYDKYSNLFFSTTENDLIENPNVNKFSFKYLTSLIDKYFLQDFIYENCFNIAFDGYNQQCLTLNAHIGEFRLDSNPGIFIRNYIPITNYTNYSVEGVLEIITDITETINNINYLENNLLLFFLVIFLIFFVIIFYSTNYAQKVIDQHIQTVKILEEAKIKVEKESNAKLQFLANVSHELRTPLNAIIGFSELIMSETYGKLEQKYSEYIKDIHNSGNHLLTIINDLLDFSKVSADKLIVESIDVDLNKLASASFRIIQQRANDAQVQLISDIPKEHTLIKADPKRLKQAIINLLSNAVKFTKPGGSVTISISKRENLVDIKFIDTGIGINEKDIPRTLGSFGQIDSTLSRKYEGTGLGLPLTKKLTELMGGIFDIKSQVNVGTTITLTFKYETNI